MRGQRAIDIAWCQCVAHTARFLSADFCRVRLALVMRRCAYCHSYGPRSDQWVLVTEPHYELDTELGTTELILYSFIKTYLNFT